MVVGWGAVNCCGCGISGDVDVGPRVFELAWRFGCCGGGWNIFVEPTAGAGGAGIVIVWLLHGVVFKLPVGWLELANDGLGLSWLGIDLWVGLVDKAVERLAFEPQLIGFC